MSADSQTRSRSQSRNGSEPIIVTPELVTDPTILDSVAGFISDVVPNAYNVPSDTKDQIQWARFEHLGYDEYSLDADSENIIPQPLILVLGYSNGVQVWSVPASGEAVELFSWKHGCVKVLKILPAPHKTGYNGLDLFIGKRPLIALCDNASPTPPFCSLNFISLKTSEQIKTIKFKNPILDVLANRTSIVVAFSERIAVFDAFTLEDKLVVTTCYLSPGITPNPVALGARWMAYAENKLIPSRRSSGGNEGEGVQSYTATVLHAAKSLGRGLRELGETVASSLTGTAPYKPGTNAGGTVPNDILQKGIVTVLDIECENAMSLDRLVETEAVVCHFTAHTEAIVCMHFDPSGMLLLTADKRGHNFHIFRIHPHPSGPALGAVHHLYVLHRGDTTARVQDMCFSPDSRWVTVSTLRGTTHVFPITPYGGPVGVRTHATPYVVNKMSRFHRSAGLTAEGRSNSPVSLFEAPVNANLPYHNPRLPPFPHPTVINPFAQIRQPMNIQNSATVQQRGQGRQRLSSSSEDNIQVVLRVCACFAPPRAWISNNLIPRENKSQVRLVESLFIMSCHGSLIQYDLDPRHVSNVPKDRICDDTAVELAVRPKAQWVLQRQPNGRELTLPLTSEALNQIYPEVVSPKTKPNHNDDKWLSQVEIVTHAGPHRRLWMGPQFTFKTYTTTPGNPVNILESKPIDVERSKPVNMPATGGYPVLIEAGSVSSCEPSPKLLDKYQRNFEDTGGACELQLKEDLADAMLESPGIREGGRRCVIVSMKPHGSGIAKVVNPLGTVVTVQSDNDTDTEPVVNEEIIHENCDEALFRPVVASKAFEPKNTVQHKVSCSSLHNRQTISPKITDTYNSINETSAISSHAIVQSCLQRPTLEETTFQSRHISSRENVLPVLIADKNIKNNKRFDLGTGSKCRTQNNKIEKSDSLSEVDSGIEKERSESPLYYDNLSEPKIAPKSSHCDQGETKDYLTSTLIGTRSKLSSVKLKPTICDISDTLLDLPEPFVLPFSDLDSIKPPMNFEVPEPLGDIDLPIQSSLSEDGLTCMMSPDVTDNNIMTDLENQKKIEELRKEKRIKNDKYQGLEPKDIVSSSEENTLEEKVLLKKPRKPKTKLGVRILSVSKGNSEEEKKDDVSVDFHISLPKRTWSTIAASKPKESSPDLSEKKEELFKYTYSVPKPTLLQYDEQDFLPKTFPDSTVLAENINLIKIDKSSDEEKVENSSSQTETTESDDSSKIPIDCNAMDTEEDNCQPEAVKLSSNISKVSKRKSKKKKR